MANTNVDLRDVLAGLRDIGKVLDRHGRDVFTELAKDIKADMRAQKRNRQSVTGVSWAPRAPATRERAQRASKPKRRKSASTGLLGKLTSAWSSKADEGGLHMENRAKIAEVHHTGGTVGHGARLPARPHLDMDPRRVEDAVDALERLAIDIWEKRKR